MPNIEVNSSPLAQVAVAAIFDAKGRVLIARRAQHAHQGGLWEFPGGKVEDGESVRQALARELHEELGIVFTQARPLIKVRHAYPDKTVLLDVWRLDISDETLLSATTGREGQPLVWVLPASLGDYTFPAANKAIVRALQLPPFYLITPSPSEDIPAFLQQLEKRLSDGIRLVQLRAKALSADDYLDLAQRCQALCVQYDARLMLNAAPELVAYVGAQGVHLDSSRLAALGENPFAQQAAPQKWLSASCHSLEQLAQAKQLGADFVMLSPVAATASHPGDEPLGWPQFQALAEQAHCPVYALGGMTPEHLVQAYEQGGQGVAAIRALWDVA
jgi:8-oxo-dGTP diphosphatase